MIDRNYSPFDVSIVPNPKYKWGSFPINYVSISP
jgi:hypothetical protein